MCLFSSPVRHVSKTGIFARALEGKRQFLAYSMNVSLDGNTAMILPLPVARAPGTSRANDDALRFVDMSSAPHFFDDLEVLFPSERVVTRAAAPAQAARPNLAVHDVGDFDASFVPSIDDFDRLDPRFRLPRELWDALPGYGDHAFAVFKLKSRPTRTTVTSRPTHPMAFEFERRDVDALFFPTVHIHDGQVHAKAHFDHTLYAQLDRNYEALCDWERSEGFAAEAREPARRFIDVSRPVYRLAMIGALPNRDTTLDRRELESRCVIGDSFRVRMNPAWRHRGVSPIDLGPKAPPPVGSEEITRRRDAIADAVSRACVEHRAGWRSIPFDADLPVDRRRYPPRVREFRSGCLVVLYGHDRCGAVVELTLAVEAPLEPGAEQSAHRAFQDAIDAAIPP